jgi:hypothetical protein
MAIQLFMKITTHNSCIRKTPVIDSKINCMNDNNGYLKKYKLYDGYERWRNGQHIQDNRRDKYPNC